MPNDRINATRARCEAATKALRDDLFALYGGNTKMITLEACHAIADTMDEMLAEIDRLTEAGRWIPLTERMPEITDADEYGAVLVGHLYDDGTMVKYSCEWVFVPDNMRLNNITHWMPLPAAPKGAEHE